MSEKLNTPHYYKVPLLQKHQDPVSVIVAYSVMPKYSLILKLGINELLPNILQK